MGKIGLDVIHKVIVSSEPFVNSLAHGALMIYGKGRLGFLSLQDSTWKFYPELDDSWCFTDLMYHKGKFYAVDNAMDKMGRFVEIGPDLVVKEAADLLYKDEAQCFYYRLVKSTDDSVFLIGETAIVFKLNEEEKCWEEVISLDGHIFFTGKDCSYAVKAAEFPGLKAYFGGTIMSSDLIFLYDDTESGGIENRGTAEFCHYIDVHAVKGYDDLGPAFQNIGDPRWAHLGIIWPPPSWLGQVHHD
jgi:hypothetical protein